MASVGAVEEIEISPLELTVAVRPAVSDWASIEYKTGGLWSVIGAMVGGVDGIGETVGVGLTIGVGDGVAETELGVQISCTVFAPPTMNLRVVVPGSSQVGPSALTTSVAAGTNLEATGPDLTAGFATTGDCPVSTTNVASKLAAAKPVTKRRFPVNIALRIDKSPINNSLIVTENFPSLSS